MTTQTADRGALAEGLRFAGLSLSINTAMAVLKIGIGLFSGSHALLANSLYSINDVLSSVAVTISVRMGLREPDETYPYGYGKAEFIATGMVSLTIAIGVFFLFFFSVIDILKGVPGPPHFIAMSMAGASMVVSWWLSRRCHHYAVELDSPSLATSAEHSHADAVGSLAALVGIGGAVIGLHVLDRIIAIFEVLHLITLSGTLLGRSLKGLMDQALPEEDLVLVKSALEAMDEIDRVAFIRSRRVGRGYWLDIAVAVSKDLTVGAARSVRARVEETVAGVLGPSFIVQVRVQGPDVVEVPVEAGGSHA